MIPVVAQPSDWICGGTAALAGSVGLILSRRYRGLVFGWLIAVAGLSAADLVPIVQREAGKCAAAWQHGDAKAVLTFLPPRVVTQSGGRAAALRDLEDQFAEARAYGVERLEAKLGVPSKPRKIGRWLVSVVPLTAVLHCRHLAITQPTHALALSTDQGKQWTFFLLHDLSAAEFAAWFPDLAGKITLPAEPAAAFDVD